jgi:hypothetical protein
MVDKNFIQQIKPGVGKRYLLFIAAIAWTFAGGMLLFKGINFFFKDTFHILIRLAFSGIGGALFYIFLFSKISRKHTLRILNLKPELPCAFSFFNLKGYLMMTIMISLGVFLRKSGVVPIKYLAILYVTMGIPLFLSAFRFYSTGFKFHKTNGTTSVLN